MAILPMLGAGVIGGIAGARGSEGNKGRNFAKGFINALPAAVGGLLGSKLPGKLGGVPGGILGTVVGGALATPEAQEARKDQSGFFPELGLSEGLGAIWGAGADARKDQSGFLPEVGLSEMGGKILGTDRTNKYRNIGEAAGSAGVKALPGAAALGEKAYGVGSAGDRASNFLGLYDDWTSSTSNSPAAQSGAFSDSERFGQQMKHQQWLKDNNRKYDSRFEGYLR